MATTAQTFMELPERGWVEVRGAMGGGASHDGADVRKFLNGVLTNNIQALAGKSGCYTCLLTPKGKIIADLFCYACGDYFGLDISVAQKQAVMETLKKYIVFQKIELVDQSEKWAALAVAGPKAREFLEFFFKKVSDTFPLLLPADYFSYYEVPWKEKSLWVIAKKLWGLEGFEIWVPKNEAAALKRALNLPELDAATQEVLRIESSTPKFGVDMDENTIPQEAGLTAALNFNKGCYIGQEIVARLEHRGHVGKRLVQLKILGDVPLSKGQKICNAEGQEIGEVTSSCFSPKHKSTLALGYVRYQFLNTKEISIGDRRGEILQ